MSRAAMNEMQAVLLEIRAELAIASKNCESLTEEADHMGTAIQSMVRRSLQHQPKGIGITASRRK